MGLTQQEWNELKQKLESEKPTRVDYTSHILGNEIKNQNKHLFLEKLNKDKTLQFTPLEIALDIINQIPITESDMVLEPFAGDGVFYNNLPICKKYKCEITDGDDFFNYSQKVDWIISNPPFRVWSGDKKYNGFPIIMNKSVKLARKGIGFLVNWKIFNAITTHRLEVWQPFNITKIKLYEIKKWFGRYYFLLFEYDKPSIILYNKSKQVVP